MKEALRAALAGPDFRRRLESAAAGAAPSTPLSLGIELGPGDDDWLTALPDAGDWWYWARPADRDWRLGLGTALQVASAGPARFPALQHAFTGLVRQWHYDRLPGAFLGFAFDEAARNELPNALLAVPAILLESREGRRSAVLTTLAGNAGEAVGQWQGLLARPAAPAPVALPRPPHHPLAGRAWQARVDAALADIDAGRLDKVVLARSIRLAAARPIAAAPVLAALLARQPESTIYAYGSRQQVFLGATPECLVRLRSGRAEADALAGTAWSEAPGAIGLGADKNRREQRLVLDTVRAVLAPLCAALEVEAPPEILALRGLSHLRSRVAGRIRPETTLFDLIRALHPTPAVGGSPTAAALDWLRRHGEKRGAWYSGGIGHIDAEGDGEIAVALRCALLSGREAELHAGAGIVAGSVASQELAETEAKLATLLDILCPEPARLERTGTR